MNARETSESTVEITGEQGDEVAVEQHGKAIAVVAPTSRGSFRRDPSLDVTVTVPTGSELIVRTGSASITATGTWGVTKTKSGSGHIQLEEVGGSAVVEAGSGGIEVGRAREAIRIKCGSGDVRIGEALGNVVISAGSGNVDIDRTTSATVVKTGSGNLTIAFADADVAMKTGSGDVVVERLNRGKFSVKASSGGVSLGIPPGVPVWTDISTVSGTLQSNLVGAGAPAEDQDHLELRLKTLSGNITLKQL